MHISVQALLNLVRHKAAKKNAQRDAAKAQRDAPRDAAFAVLSRIAKFVDAKSCEKRESVDTRCAPAHAEYKNRQREKKRDRERESGEQRLRTGQATVCVFACRVGPYPSRSKYMAVTN